MKVRAFIHGTSADFSSLQEKFDALSEIWEEYNVGRSVTRYEHSAYLQVIGMGQAAIPLLLRSVAAGNTDWIYALKCITGEQVETPETIGDADEVIEAWITWGRRNGYIRSAPIHKDVR